MKKVFKVLAYLLGGVAAVSIVLNFWFFVDSFWNNPASIHNITLKLWMGNLITGLFVGLAVFCYMRVYPKKISVIGNAGMGAFLSFSLYGLINVMFSFAKGYFLAAFGWALVAAMTLMIVMIFTRAWRMNQEDLVKKKQDSLEATAVL